MDDADRFLNNFLLVVAFVAIVVVVVAAENVFSRSVVAVVVIVVTVSGFDFARSSDPLSVFIPVSKKQVFKFHVIGI